jgi:hypothetical protein
METQKPSTLRIVKSEPIGLMGYTHYATDPEGNVWHTNEVNGKQGEWRLYKKAAEVAAQQAPLSFEQMLKLNIQE